MVTPQLNFKKEQNTIKGALTESGQSINYKSMVATKDNFVATIHSAPKVIHISCHGIRNEVSTMKTSFSSIKEEGNFLLFETGYGAGELISSKDLREHVTKSPHVIDLVFVAACQSEDIGKIFQECGARHVVCVKKTRSVLDDAAIKFTKTFYSCIFKGFPICTAFDLAK